MTPSLSIIIPVFNEEESLKPLHEKISTVLSQSSVRYEIIFIDDGSRDNSLKIIKELKNEYPYIHWISFRKNFGKAAALQTGFKSATGSIILTMDADLQDEPEEIQNFVNKIQEGYDMVSGWKFNRLDPLEKRLPSKLFNWFISTVSGIKLHDFNCGFKAYRREVVADLDIYGELHRYIPVLANRSGFKIAEIKVKHNPRQFGKSKYGFERYLRGLFDCISIVFLSKYYQKPMHFFGKLGLFLGFGGIVICSILTAQWFMGESIGGRPLLILGVLLLILGVQFVSIGLIGEMLVDATYHQRYNERHIKEKNLEK